MSSNRLRVNSSKTKCIWLGTRQQLPKLDMATLASEFAYFIFSCVVRDLGVILDQELTFAPHLNLLTRASYYQLRKLRTVARSLTPTAIATLVHSSGAHRLAYCSCLYTLASRTPRLSCLDRILRTAARLIAVVGPSIWNGLHLSIRSLPRTLSQTFLSQLKAVLFGRIWIGSASE